MRYVLRILFSLERSWTDYCIARNKLRSCRRLRIGTDHIEF